MSDASLKWPVSFSRAGESLYEAKKGGHPAVHMFPSSVDVTHFAKAREITEETDEHVRSRIRVLDLRA